ncbi:MAG: ion transporter [Pseudomonadota bacterium]|nr:ion transporter [Pseudomonadota bacterium]
MRETVKKLVESRGFQTLVLGLIVVNAIVLGADTLPAVRDSSLQPAFGAIDRVIIYAFTVEVGLRLFAFRGSYFKSGWNVFDFLIVLVSLFATSSGLSAIRAFRVLRVLRVVTIIPRMRTVVAALLEAIPGIASVGVVLLLIDYVFAVIGASLYGPEHPEIFGDVFAAMYTLFQVMTLEGWPDIARQVGETHPNSWLFFLTFVLIGTFTMLNLFVAIVVRAVEEDTDSPVHEVIEQNKALAAELSEIKTMLARLENRAAR